MSKVKNASILVTGANGGLGIETVKLLSEANASRIVLACRTKAKADWAMSQISQPSNTQLEPHGGFDMTDFDSIQHAVEGLPAGEQFDIVFLQSGGMVVANDFQFINAGNHRIERSIYQNVLGGYFTLVCLAQRELIAPQARIVYAGGEGARGVKGLIEKPVFDSVQDLRTYISKGRGKYGAVNALGVSKFMSALLVQKLALLDPEREHVWFSPGLTGDTNGLNALPGFQRFVLGRIGFPLMQLLGFAQNPRKAAQKYVDCLSGKYGQNGDLLGAPEGKALGKIVDQKPMNSALTNHQFRDAFWEIALQSCGSLEVPKVESLL